MEIIQTMGYIFGILFSFWPFLIFSTFSQRRISVLKSMMAMWIFIFIGWVFSRFVEQLPSFFIPEPLNTYLFFGTGVILVSLRFLLRK